MKTGIEKFTAGTSKLHTIDPRKIVVRQGWNVRVRTPALDDHIRELTDSIKANGLQEPLTLAMKNGEPVLTNGNCRHEAIMLAIEEGANIDTVRFQLENRGATEADHVASMIIRNSGKPLDLSEKARVFDRMRKLGVETTDIATKVGCRHNHVTSLLNFIDTASPEIFKMIKDGKVSSSMAVHTVIKHGHKATAILKKGIEKAENAGKTKASATHIEAAKRDIVKPIEKFAATIAETDPVRHAKILALTEQLRQLM